VDGHEAEQARDDGADRATRQIALQAVRIPMLLAVLALLGPPLLTFQRALMRAELPTAGRGWVVIAAVVLVFVVVALLGRTARHPPGILAVEAVVAGLLGLIPPTAWISWFGISGLPLIMGIAAGSVVVPVLALAWLAIVATTGMRQWRAARERRELGTGVAAGAGRSG